MRFAEIPAKKTRTSKDLKAKRVSKTQVYRDIADPIFITNLLKSKELAAD